MGRDIREAAQYLATATDKRLAMIVKRDPDMIRDVARAMLPKPERRHHADCELRGGPCPCDQDREDEYYK